jgi:hypothetical protein
VHKAFHAVRHGQACQRRGRKHIHRRHILQGFRFCRNAGSRKMNYSGK